MKRQAKGQQSTTVIHRLKLLSIFASLSITLINCSTAPEKTLKAPPPPKPEIVQVSDRAFEMDTLYALMVAEMAGDRRRFDIMLSNYVQQAEATRDVGITARATRLARYLKAHSTTLDMALLWTELDTGSTEARYVAAAELVHANRLLEAVAHAKILIEQNETTGFEAIAARAQQGGDITTTHQLLAEFEPLITQYPNHPALNIGISLLYQHAGKLEKALFYTKKAVVLAPEDFQAKAQETRILQQLGRTEEALEQLGKLVKDHPKNDPLRLQYARSLLKTNLEGAQNQFEKLLDHDKSNSDLTLTLALIKYERGLLDQAKEHFITLLDHSPHSSAAYFYLGRIALTQKDQVRAVQLLSQVKSGSNYLPAISLISEIFISHNQVEKAIALVQDQRLHTPTTMSKQAQGLYLLESHILTTQGQYLEAIDLLKQGIETFPNSSTLIYSRAMLFTRIDQISHAEQDLKRVLSLSPDNAAALNALGYTLADRTNRLDEAYLYIQKAYSLTPDDPAVMDSLGWVEFRRGNHQRALESLRLAMEAMPDHEIAAHLGEVLWVTGQTEQAQKVWKSGLKLNPTSQVIRSTIQRLQAEPKE